MEARDDGRVKLDTGDQIRFGFGGKTDVPHVNGVPLRGVVKVALESSPETDFVAKLSLDMLAQPVRLNAAGTDAERYVVEGYFLSKADFDAWQSDRQERARAKPNAEAPTA